MKTGKRLGGIGSMGVVLAAILLSLSTIHIFIPESAAQQEKPMTGPGPGKPMVMPMIGLGGPGRIEERGLTAMLHIWETYFFLQRGPLKLTEDQIERIVSILNDQRKYIIQKKAEQRILLIDIEQLLVKEPTDLKKVEEKVKAFEDLNVEITMGEVQTLGKALAVLTPEQRQKMLAIFRESRFTGPYGT
jgi:Spy/CpxP family protein refolding chaperone